MNLKRSVIGSVAFAGIFMLSGCPENPSVVKYQAPKPEKVEAAAPSMAMMPNSDLPPALTGSGNIEWAMPEGWVDGKASSMRMASFAIPHSDGTTGDVSLVQLAGMAGGMVANVNRWRGQVGLQDLSAEALMRELDERVTVGGHKYLVVEMFNETSGNAIMAGIYESGGATLFAKLSTNKAGMNEARDGFYQFCDSINFKDHSH